MKFKRRKAKVKTEQEKQERFKAIKKLVLPATVCVLMFTFIETDLKNTSFDGIKELFTEHWQEIFIEIYIQTLNLMCGFLISDIFRIKQTMIRSLIAGVYSISVNYFVDYEFVYKFNTLQLVLFIVSGIAVFLALLYTKYIDYFEEKHIVIDSILKIIFTVLIIAAGITLIVLFYVNHDFKLFA